MCADGGEATTRGEGLSVAGGVMLSGVGATEQGAEDVVVMMLVEVVVIEEVVPVAGSTVVFSLSSILFPAGQDRLWRLW